MYDTSEHRLPDELASTAPVASLTVSMCPACEEPELFRRGYHGDDTLTVHQCFRCEGFWIDHGTVQKIRQRYRTAVEAQRDQAVRVQAAISSAKLRSADEQAKVWDDYWQWIERQQNKWRGD
ncbi:MAG: zf-TFIIB domain-containing protein [Bdellovibrionota bacterium]|nr:MAG: zf-TFIIB domain-containing protein [Bdellovibrionota bacterium]